jgi:hypothetical protein
MKLIALLAALAFLAGCSSTPRIGDVSGADYSINVDNSSSAGLRALAKADIAGVRDLTAAEYESVSDDVDKFDKLADARDTGIDPNLYAAISGVTGASLGLSLDYAAGVAILGRLAADDREFNYRFADDFRSDAVLYSPLSVDDLMNELSLQIPGAMSEFNRMASNLFAIDIDTDPIIVSVKAGDKGNRTGKDIFEYVGVVAKDVDGRKVSSQFHLAVLCNPRQVSDSLCEMKIRFLVDRKENPAVSLLVQEVSKSLPAESLVYMPPRKDLYQLPMVYDTSGEPMILVQSGN